MDLVDVTQEFLDKAKTYLGEDGKRVGGYFCCGLQDFVPESGRYDVIWIQWVIGESCTGCCIIKTRACYWPSPRTVIGPFKMDQSQSADDLNFPPSNL